MSNLIRRTFIFLTVIAAAGVTGWSGEDLLPPAPEGSFGIAVIPDTQAYRGRVLAEHASRRAIVASHMGLGPLLQPKQPEDFFAAAKGRMQWKKIHGSLGNTPQQMWDKCFRRHANVFLILSGDQSRTQALRQVSQNDAGRPVHEVLSDYMATTGTPDCWLRICRFLPAENRIDVFTVDSRTGRLCPGTKLVPHRDAHQFSLPYAMTDS